MEQQNTYIMNMDAIYLYKDIHTEVEIKLENKNPKKIFSATIPYSLETIRIDNMFEGEFYMENNKQYTKSIINLEFKRGWVEYKKVIDEQTGETRNVKDKVIASNKKIRKFMYKNGFTMDGFKYVFYKRGAGKAKNGSVLFVKEHMLKHLRNRSRLGIDFSKDKTVDFTSIFAYDALIMSGIDFTVKINPKTEMLLVSDIYGLEFDSLANVTKEIDGSLVTGNEIIKIQNCLSDGHGFLCSSVFEKYDKKDKGFMLLRNDFMKCCAFNTKLKEWFIHNNVETVKDMFGTEYDASKIKLVVTPNSLKFLKLKGKFNNSEKECYDYYINNIDDVFGVVKCDKRGNYNDHNRTTYQLLNSLPKLNKKQLKEIVQYEVNYVNMLKNDSSVYLNYIGMDASRSLEFEESEQNEEDKMDNIELMNALLLVNSDIQYTHKFREMKKKLIKNYVDNLYMGKLRMRNTIYTTLVSNPYELLLHTIGKYEDKSIMSGREIWCPQYEDGQELCGSRNPQINSGNVMLTKNKYREEYKWFNITPDISVINFFDNDAPDRLQGCDTDSDTLLLLPHDVLVKNARYCEKNYPTPINKVKGVAKERKNTMEELAKLDILLSENYIGKIINLSQIANSYMNNAIQLGLDESVIEELYNASSRCSSLSQIEIDKSKKTFDNINMSKELSKIRNIPSFRFVTEKTDEDKDVKKMVVPKFFNKISDFSDFRIFEKMHTPMDMLEDVLKFERTKNEINLEFKDLLIKPKEVEGKQIHLHIKKIYDAVSKCGKTINGTRMKNCKLNEQGKKAVQKNAKLECIESINTIGNLTQATILYIIRMAFGVKNDDYGFAKYSMLTLNMLYLTNATQTLGCFKSKDMSEDEVLVKSKNGEYNIFGIGYTKTNRKSLKTK